MRILFDHQTFRIQRYGGISLYISQLIRGINEHEGNSARVTLPYFENENLPQQLVRQDSLQALAWRAIPRKGRRISNLFSLHALATHRYDLLHATYYDPYFLTDFVQNKPWIVTFHDMIHETLGNRFVNLDTNFEAVVRAKHRLAHASPVMIAISEFTKQQMVNQYQIDPERIRVVHHGNPYEGLNPVDDGKPSDYPFPYFLYVGARHTYKNFNLLIRAIADLLKRHNVHLVCAGGGAFPADEIGLIRAHGLAERVHFRAVRNHDLPHLYHHAAAFVFPSLQEGFGFPVLEAFACRCPCALSDSSCLPEIAGDAALYFDPEHPDSIETVLERLLSLSPSERSQLIERGRQRLAQFSWQQTVKRTLTTYQQRIEQRFA